MSKTGWSDYVNKLLIAICASWATILCMGCEMSDRAVMPTTKYDDTPVPISFDSLRQKVNTQNNITIKSVPNDIKYLNGKRVAILGFINPPEIRNGSFILLGTNEIPNDTNLRVDLDEVIAVTLDQEWKGSVPIRKIMVAGVLQITEIKDDITGQVVAIYRISEATMSSLPMKNALSLQF